MTVRGDAESSVAALCRPIERPVLAFTAHCAADAAFQSWLQSLWPQAQQLGVSRATFDVATRELEPDLRLPDLVIPGRPEKPRLGSRNSCRRRRIILRRATIERLAAQGRKLFDQYRPRLRTIERQFGVDPTVVLAIFGRETDYGRAADTRSAIRVLATQAYLGKRKDKFREEFLLALKMLGRTDSGSPT